MLTIPPDSLPPPSPPSTATTFHPRLYSMPERAAPTTIVLVSASLSVASVAEASSHPAANQQTPATSVAFSHPRRQTDKAGANSPTSKRSCKRKRPHTSPSHLVDDGSEPALPGAAVAGPEPPGRGLAVHDPPVDAPADQVVDQVVGLDVDRDEVDVLCISVRQAPSWAF